MATSQRGEASRSVVRGHADSLMKPTTARDAAGLELLDEGAPGQNGGDGVRLKV